LQGIKNYLTKGGKMNQDQLIDHISDLLKSGSEKGPGILLLCFKEDFSVLHVKEKINPDTQILTIIDSETFRAGLTPSLWINLARKVWACKCTKTNTIPFGNPKSKAKKDPNTTPTKAG